MAQEEVLRALTVLYQERSRLIILGFTGRTGTGCSSASKLLSLPFDRLPLPKPLANPDHPEDRKYRIVYRYAAENWTAFNRLSVTGLLVGSIVTSAPENLRSFLEQSFKKVGREEASALADLVRGFREKHAKPLAGWNSDVVLLRDDELFELCNLYFENLEPLLDEFKAKLKANYIPLFQSVGDNIRRSGNPFSSDINPESIYAVSRRIDHAIQARSVLDKRQGSVTRIAVDALRNPFEAIFFKDRYASFYLVAVNAEDEDREARLSATVSREDIRKFDEKEYPRTRLAKASTYEAYISQDIQGCIEKADIHIHNPGRAREGEERNLSALAIALVRYVILALHPGLVTPTRIERCMQLAYSAKVNSGCISRQVGAVVTTKDGAVMAVGWNDVPFKQIPCLLRDVQDLIGGHDSAAFSEHELKDAEFRSHIKKKFTAINAEDAGGRSCPFCFRDAYNEQHGTKDRSMTRSLHAEENAFLQVAKTGGAALAGGHLYSTASPCELCSKKAYQLGIEQIWYVDPYPGISRKQILDSGPVERRPKLHLFHGAIGDAYHKLYDQLMPYKDEISAYVIPDNEKRDLLSTK